MTSPNGKDPGISSHAFFLADYASVESGKAYVSGGFWTRMALPEFPATAYFSVMAVINVPWSAYGSVHAFSITVSDDAGNDLHPRFDGQFQVVNSPQLQMGDPTIMPLAAVLNGMAFEAPGEFVFLLGIDGEEIARWPLRVVLAEEPDDPTPEAEPTEPTEPLAGPPLDFS